MASFEIRDPRTASVIATMEDTPTAVVDQMGATAKAAWGSWRALGTEERAVYLRRIRRAFYQRRHELVDHASTETGKPEAEVIAAEILANLDLITYFCKAAPKVLAPEPASINPINYPRKRGYTVHEPLGTVAVVSSWNYPIALPMRAIVPALLAGNCVLFKPSKEAALTGQCLGEIFAENLPAGVFATAQGGRDVIRAVVKNSNRLQFIGSTSTGHALARQCADQMIPSAWELSGVDAAIVLPDCDLERTVHGVVWGAFTNAGQNCASIERLLVHRDIASVFLPRIVEETRKLRLGKDVGPLRSETQLKTVEAHLADALQRGGRVLCGGKRTGTGYYHEPTIVELPKHEGLAIQEETFGPTLPVVIVDSVDEAVRLCNEVNYGLTASVWTRDLAEGERICERLDVGVAMVNNASFTAAMPHAPWGGVKGTGYGVTNSPAILHEMTHPKFVLVDANPARELWWYPYNDRLRELLDALVDANAGKIHRLVSALPNMLRRWE